MGPKLLQRKNKSSGGSWRGRVLVLGIRICAGHGCTNTDYRALAAGTDDWRVPGRSLLRGVVGVCLRLGVGEDYRWGDIGTVAFVNWHTIGPSMELGPMGCNKGDGAWLESCP